METPRGILEKNTSGTGRADAEAGPVTDLSVRGDETMVPEPVHALLVTPSPELNTQRRRCPPAFPAACPVVGWPRRGVPSAPAHPSAPRGHPAAPRGHPAAPGGHIPLPQAGRAVVTPSVTAGTEAAALLPCALCRSAGRSGVAVGARSRVAAQAAPGSPGSSTRTAAGKSHHCDEHNYTI